MSSEKEGSLHARDGLQDRSGATTPTLHDRSGATTPTLHDRSGASTPTLHDRSGAATPNLPSSSSNFELGDPSEPSKEDLMNLRHIGGKVSAEAWLIAFCSGAERFAFYTLQAPLREFQSL